MSYPARGDLTAFWRAVVPLGLVFWAVLPAYAVPPAPIEHTLQQPDGTLFAARQWGDEWLHGWETLEGYTIVRDAESGYWTYAQLSPAGELVSSGRLVGRHAPTAGVPLRARPAAQPLREQVRARRLEAAARVVPPTGTARVPVILVTFSDRNPTYTPADFEALLFGDNPDIATGPGSMKDYFEEVSYGAFSVTSAPSGVRGWYPASQNHDYYGQDVGGSGNDAHAAELVREAVQLADADVDFSQYDNDGDGKVDVVMIVHQGTGQEASGVASDIWSHRWSLSGAGVGTIMLDGKIIDDYIIQPERLGNDISTVGVFAHEFGHSLGLPDLYDTDYSSEGVGKWGLMGGGSWNRTSRSGDTPAHMTAWSKWFLGWTHPKQIRGFVDDQSIQAAAMADDVYLLLWNPGGVDWRPGSPGDGEYFLVENRQRVGFDAGLPGDGLAIWHIDESRANNNDETRKLVDLEEADGLNHLDSGSNSGDAGDVYPGSSNSREFTGGSTPNSRWYDGRSTGCRVTDISDSGRIMTADLGCPYAVTHPWWDDIGAILTSLGYEFFELFDEYHRLADPDFLNVFQTIFLNCAGDIYVDAAIAAAVRQYVEGGGSLYASDWAYPYVTEIFPGYIHFFGTDPRQGVGDQTVTATVTDTALANYLGTDAIEVYYDLDGWVVIDSVSPDANELLRGNIEIYDGVSPSPGAGLRLDRIRSRRTATRAVAPQQSQVLNDRPLAASFRAGQGLVIYTTFHNHAQLTDLQRSLLEYLVLSPITAAITQQLEDVLNQLGYQLEDQVVNRIDPGGEMSFRYEVRSPRDVLFTLAWGGSTMRLSVYRPDGTLYAQRAQESSPISIEVPGAEAGIWTYRVTAVDVPYPNYPFAAAVGIRNAPPVARAGPDRYAVVGSPVRLSGAASYDPDEGDSVVLYEWTLVSWPAGSNAAIQDPDGADPWAEFTPDKPGRYVARLKVKDSLFRESEADVVTVEATVAYAAPNPAGFSVTFHYEGRLAGGALKVYNVAGRLLRSLPLSGGGSTGWDLTDREGRPLASGLYLWMLFDKDGKPVLSKPERLVIQR